MKIAVILAIVLGLVAAEPARFGVIGDFGDLGDIGRAKKNYWGKVSNAMNKFAQYNPFDFLMTVGDNVYPNGIEKDGDYSQMDAILSHLKKPYLKDLEVYATLGNHDCYSDYRREIQYTTDQNGQTWQLPSEFYDLSIPVGDGKEMGILMLNSCTLTCGKLDNESNLETCDMMHEDIHSQRFLAQLSWIKSKLADYNANPNVVWTAVVMHHPPLIQAAIKKYLLPTLREYDVDFMIVGHKHQNEYAFLDKDYVISKPEESFTGNILLDCVDKEEDHYYADETTLVKKQGDGIHQILVGSSGTKMKKICPVEEFEADLRFQTSKEHSFVTVEASEESVQFRWISKDMEELYKLTVER